MATASIEVTRQSVVLLPLSALITSKDNPRKSFQKETLEELAADIKKHGVLSPIIARKSGEKFEVICGERRVRASKLAEHSTIPAIVRELTDEEADELRFVENEQRENLAPMETAQALAQWKDLPVADIAAKIGKEPRYVERTLRLLSLIPEAQKSLSAGKILLGHAYELVKLRPEEQKQALGWLNSASDSFQDPSSTDWVQIKTAHSVEALRRYVAAYFMLKLENAPFDTADPHLDLKMGACASCQFNTANVGALFGDVKGARCTVPSCFDQKTERSIAATLDALKKESDKPVLRLGIGWEGRNEKKVKVDAFYSASWDNKVVAVEPGKECDFAQKAVVVYVDPAQRSPFAKVGAETIVCIDEKCGKHHRKEGSSNSARQPLKGLAFVEHKQELLHTSLGQRVRNEAYKQLCAKLIEKCDNAFGKYPATFAALLDYTRRHLYLDRWRDAGKALGIEKPEKKSEFQGPNWEGAVVKHFGKNQAALMLALVAAEGIVDSDKKNAFYSIAEEFKVDVPGITRELAKQDKALIAEMRTRAKEKTAKDAPKSKAKAKPKTPKQKVAKKSA